MSYLTDSERGSILAVPAAIGAVYRERWRSFAADLGPVDYGLRLGAAILPVAFAAIVAWDLKPYGPEPARFDIQTLIEAESLACDDYVRLAWELSQMMPQTTWFPLRIAALGFNAGAVGNHAQMMVADGRETLLLDPTVGLVVRVGYNQLLQGKPVQDADIASFWHHNADRPLKHFHDAVNDALRLGQYLPSDMLYFADSLDDFNKMVGSSLMETPGIARFRFA